MAIKNLLLKLGQKTIKDMLNEYAVHIALISWLVEFLGSVVSLGAYNQTGLSFDRFPDRLFKPLKKRGCYEKHKKYCVAIAAFLELRLFLFFGKSINS